jgi:hypothetical protein
MRASDPRAKELVDALSKHVFGPWSEEQEKRLGHIFDRVNRLDQQLQEHCVTAHGPRAKGEGANLDLLVLEEELVPLQIARHRSVLRDIEEMLKREHWTPEVRVYETLKLVLDALKGGRA